ncbi:HAMP domain-containing histidine kinase [Chitiniphilus purpureus]|uniref:histidine kinase n=1 Tax=Chitiniphilus purpureus TaxID=2981137 RepID=A0ABY6DPC5_9NEIS|nr:HAMP domain-containing sensor histidine kinase [Chitiniphilus sp. CD1]UXY14946.1 HAMP domain-containing histidine kinase [Chitiniphilus sp. CD1]
MRRLSWYRLSFRQLLLLAFLLVGTVLSASSFHVLLALERLAVQSRESAQAAVKLTEAAERLGERTLTMERSARQFLVLDDPEFRQRFEEAWQDAGTALRTLARLLPGVSRDEFEAWQAHGDGARVLLDRVRPRRGGGEAALFEHFSRLRSINAELSLAAKRRVELANDALSAELERQRGLLAAQIAAALVLAVLLALGFGLWLTRPLARIEGAIARLGEGRFDDEIAIRGPIDLRRVAEQLDWLRRRLAALEADKARFLRHVSHELKTPLAALREGVALLDDEVPGPLAPAQHEVVGILRQNVAALQSQIESLLRYNAAVFEAGRAAHRRLPLVAQLAGVIDAQQLQWQARALTVSIEGDEVTIRADADQLGAVFSNLLSNAIRFSPEGGEVRFVVSEQADRVRIDCYDEGPGVAQDDAPRIFEPFYQGRRQPPGARHGSGIGLSIVQEYIAAHGGSVALLPSERGAHFRIELPL